LLRRPWYFLTFHWQLFRKFDYALHSFAGSPPYSEISSPYEPDLGIDSTVPGASGEKELQGEDDPAEEASTNEEPRGRTKPTSNYARGFSAPPVVPPFPGSSGPEGSPSSTGTQRTPDSFPGEEEPLKCYIPPGSSTLSQEYPLGPKFDDPVLSDGCYFLCSHGIGFSYFLSVCMFNNNVSFFLKAISDDLLDHLLGPGLLVCYETDVPRTYNVSFPGFSDGPYTFCNGPSFVLDSTPVSCLHDCNISDYQSGSKMLFIGDQSDDYLQLKMWLSKNPFCPFLVRSGSTSIVNIGNIYSWPYGRGEIWCCVPEYSDTMRGSGYTPPPPPPVGSTCLLDAVSVVLKIDRADLWLVFAKLLYPRDTAYSNCPFPLGRRFLEQVAQELSCSFLVHWDSKDLAVGSNGKTFELFFSRKHWSHAPVTSSPRPPPSTRVSDLSKLPLASKLQIWCRSYSFQYRIKINSAKGALNALESGHLGKLINLHPGALANFRSLVESPPPRQAEESSSSEFSGIPGPARLTHSGG